MSNMNVRTAKSLIVQAEKSCKEIEDYYKNHSMIADEIGFLINVVGCLEDYKKILLKLIDDAELKAI